MAKIDDEVKTRFQNNKHRLLTNVIFTSNWITGLTNSLFKQFGISREQFNILRILKGANDWKTMTDIKILMIHKTPNTTRLSDKLLDKGLVERKRSDTDRRIVYLRITQKGLDLLLEIDTEQEKSEIFSFLGNISDEEAGHFSQMLDRLREKHD
ncbi:MarR family transcriptional regulator [Flammeovirga pectinis]|uniref:MarR family transcriptional regulator n=1 Tax=Flammeovirga pectinis TaxID=2494373 RepID=A0A3Q9FMQ9_9BACT|nr:MarR family transcriptional regulator [Flammeovirga pectinis]AZQ63086.1 MarR family transcriptional regulator [Flammeovirga pectinis]